MKQRVDKQEEHELRRREAVFGRLPLGDEGADDDLAVPLAGLVREYVGHVVLAAERDVKRLRTRLSRKHERDIPARE